MKRPLLLTALVLMLFASTAWAQKSSLQYRGFNVNFAQINNLPRKNAILNSVKEQIDIVERVGLSRENLDFFRSVPIVMLADSSGTPGKYKRETKTIHLKARDLAANKPILLHEFLHAYHNQRLPEGMKNKEVLGFYEKAEKAFPEFKGNQYFLQNQGEFFAVTGSIYLFGNISRPPYNRRNIKEKMPLYYKYLASLFGEGRG
jgi:hypothetical protein